MSYADAVARWRNGSEGFFRFLEDVKPVIRSSKGGFTPFIPGPRERAEIVKALDGDHATVVLSWPRRHGKSATTCMILLWRFMSRPTENIAVVANAEKQVISTAFKILRDAFANTPALKRMTDAGNIEVGQDFIRFPATSSLIQAYASNPSALWGKALSVAQLSELHASKGADVLEVLTGSLLDSEGSMLLIDSTVGPMSSPLYALYQAHLAGDDPSLFFSHISYTDLEDACANGPSWIDPVRLRAAARRMLPQQFGLYHLNRWGDASSLLIDGDTLALCTEQTYQSDPKAISAGAAYVVAGGLDRAFGGSRHGDATVTTAVVMTTIDDEEHYFVLDSDAVMFSRLGGIKSNFRRYYKDWGMSRAALETYGAQDVYDWAQAESFAEGTELITPSRKVQYQAFTLLATAAAEGRLHIDPRFEKLIEELKTFEIVDDGKETVGNEALPKFGHPTGKHDDHVYSLAWAMFATREITLNPYELNGVRCSETGPARTMCALNGGTIIPMCAGSCRSMRLAFDLFDQYASRSPRNNLPVEGFIIDKIKNIGSHTIAR